MTAIVKNPHTEERHELMRQHDKKQISDEEYDKLFKPLVEKEKDFLDRRLAELGEKVYDARQEVEEAKEGVAEKSKRTILKEVRALYKVADNLVLQTRELKKVMRENIEERGNGNDPQI